MANLYPSFFSDRDIRGRIEAGFDAQIIGDICRGFATKLKRQHSEPATILFAHSQNIQKEFISSILENFHFGGLNVEYFEEKEEKDFLKYCWQLKTDKTKHYRLYLLQDLPLYAMKFYQQETEFDVEQLENLQEICELGHFCFGQGLLKVRRN